jgi:hypothetical protein
LLLATVGLGTTTHGDGEHLLSVRTPNAQFVQPLMPPLRV